MRQSRTLKMALRLYKPGKPKEEKLIRESTNDSKVRIKVLWQCTTATTERKNL
jgi:hypothetical protein